MLRSIEPDQLRGRPPLFIRIRFIKSAGRGRCELLIATASKWFAHLARALLQGRLPKELWVGDMGKMAYALHRKRG